MERQHKPRSPQVKRRTGTEVLPDRRTRRERERGQKEAAVLARELDDILEEVDKVLEENAQEFVEAYRQIGGE